MKTILRNLFYTLKRFQTASVLNLMGLRLPLPPLSCL